MELYNQAIERDIIAYLQDQTVPVSQAELEKAKQETTKEATKAGAAETVQADGSGEDKKA